MRLAYAQFAVAWVLRSSQWQLTMKKIVLTALIVFGFSNLHAQEESKSPFTFSGYVDVYYSYDFAKPEDHTRPGFFYSYNKSNEVNLNMGMAKVNYSKENIRGNFALMAGTYAEYNMSAEQGLLKNVYEANVGVKISQKHNLWVDAGIMPSHIGFESAISKDCWVLTRNISSENTPYYEAGAKLTYGTADGKLTATILYLNGWQKIKRLDGNSKPAGGLQLTYKPSSKIICIDNIDKNKKYSAWFSLVKKETAKKVATNCDIAKIARENNEKKLIENMNKFSFCITLFIIIGCLKPSAFH